MVLQEGGDRTLCMYTQECISTKFIEYDEPQLKDRTKAELISNINITSEDMSIVKEKRVGKMQDVSHENYIPATNIIGEDRLSLWMGKPKGILQVLWQCGFMDISKDVCTY